ncbi:MAG: PhnA domain-containing protein [Bacteroidota bacterium]
MSIESELIKRSNNSCELCESNQSLSVYEVPPTSQGNIDDSIIVCENCKLQLEKKTPLNAEHWGCLNTAMWSEVPAVKVVVWRMLNRLNSNTWAFDALDMMYMEDEHLNWAKETGDHEDQGDLEFHRDCNGAILQTGDSVTLIKTLEVKGSQVKANVGVAVRNIRLVHDNVEQIEGKIDGQQIVILTKYVKRQ